MPDSPINRHSPPQNSAPQLPKPHENVESLQKRLCDFCGETTALLYCRADTAKLCLSCDRQVHTTNQLFTKHTRFQLCDVCDSSPASILCFTEHSVLCQNCDYELHSSRLRGGSAAPHDRRPLEGFTGCPSLAELSALVGFQGFDSKSLLAGDYESEGFNGASLCGLLDDEIDDGFSDLFVWDAPAVVSIDDLIASTDKDHNFHAMMVPPLPKDRNLCCGQHKHEILNQLRELAKSEPVIKQDTDSPITHYNVTEEKEKDFRIKHLRGYQHDEEQAALLLHEASPHNWGNDAGNGEAVNDVVLSSVLSVSHIEESFLNSDGQSRIALDGQNPKNPTGTESLACPPKLSTHEFSSVDRDSAISRYKEKKRTRRYDRHIRYESRKVQAENRTRVKGRFAKIDPRMNQG